MKVCLLGSGSKGNSLYIEHRGTSIILDQGFSHKEMARRMTLRGIDPGNVTGILVSHEHNDHIRGVGISARKLGIPVYATGGTLYGRKEVFKGHETLISIESGTPFEIGPFNILPYQVSHDAAEPVQYCVMAGNKKVVVATDLGFVSNLVEQCLRDADLIVLEANHDVEMLRNGSYPWELKQRIMSRVGHLSNRNAADILFNLVNGKSSPYVILAHLSEENNTAEAAERTVRDLFEKYDKKLDHLYVAKQDIPTELIDL